MATIRPPNGPSFPDKMNKPIFPPMSHLTANGLTPPIFPPNSSTLSSQSNQHTYQTNTSIFPPTQQYQSTSIDQYNSNPISSSNIYNTKMNSTPPPPPPSNIYNPPLNHQPIPSLPPPPTTTTYTLSSQPTIRPMYPSPTSAYHSQVQQPQLVSQTTYPQMINPNSQPLPPPPPPSSSSTYPYSQQNSNSNTTATTSYLTSTYPGQISSLPQSMPYAMGTNTGNQQINNMNGPVSNNNLMDLLKVKSVVSPYAEEIPISPLLNEENQQMNCSPEVMRCSLNVIPQTKDLLNKSRLPLGVLIHPFKDLESLSVIQGTKIVRCDACKSYINPFVIIQDNTRWRCSICFRQNDLPQEFLFDPITKTYGDPSRRPEVRFGTVEYTASSDYMARPPQPAMYLFLLDVSHNAIQTGYLQSFCDILFENLNNLPGDARTQIGFIAYDSRIHFYDLSDRQNGTFHIMIAPDIENIENKLDEFLPLPDGLMVTLCDCRTIIETFLNELPKVYQNNHETDSALGTALLIAEKLLHNTGGRVTVIQTRIPNINPGALNENIGKEPTSIGPTSDYYKKLSLDYASQQIACDLFLLNSHYIDLTTLTLCDTSSKNKYIAGCGGLA
ncbi:unnamed protein product [Rotaria sp. Silwood1]|nr:unnamed protein product [Rotaria sp. Silwood1]